MPVVVLSRDCPGYAEAARREDEIRAVPFLGVDERIAGLTIAPLTLRRVQWLTMIRSPFLLNLPAETLVEKPDIAADIGAFLWIVSPEFKVESKRAKARFFKRKIPAVMKMNALKVIKEIREYVEEAFLDSGKSEGEQRNYYSTAAAVVGFFHRNYGLQIDVWENNWARNIIRKLTGQPNILDVPLKIAFQLIRAHQKSVNPDTNFYNSLSQPKIDEWLAGLNGKRN